LNAWRSLSYLNLLRDPLGVSMSTWRVFPSSSNCLGFFPDDPFFFAMELPLKTGGPSLILLVDYCRVKLAKRHKMKCRAGSMSRNAESYNATGWLNDAISSKWHSVR